MRLVKVHTVGRGDVVPHDVENLVSVSSAPRASTHSLALGNPSGTRGRVKQRNPILDVADVDERPPLAEGDGEEQLRVGVRDLPSDVAHFTPLFLSLEARRTYIGVPSAAERLAQILAQRTVVNRLVSLNGTGKARIEARGEIHVEPEIGIMHLLDAGRVLRDKGVDGAAQRVRVGGFPRKVG